MKQSKGDTIKMVCNVNSNMNEKKNENVSGISIRRRKERGDIHTTCLLNQFKREFVRFKQYLSRVVNMKANYENSMIIAI